MLTVKVTNEEKFKQIDEVDFEQASRGIWRGGFDGNVFIQLKNGAEINSTGEHGVNNWEEEFGFVVVEKEEE